MSQKNSAGWVPAILGGVVGATLTAGVLFLAGMLIMAWNVIRTTMGAKSVEAAIPVPVPASA